MSPFFYAQNSEKLTSQNTSLRIADIICGNLQYHSAINSL